MNTFRSFNLPDGLHQALDALAFHEPTEIQSKAIPTGLEGRDLVACAQTGTGKTAAFGLPLAVHLLNTPQSIALILAPTRELALQIELVWRDLTRFVPGLRGICLIGGLSFNTQVQALRRRPRMVIATPGRLLDHLNQRTMELSKVGVLVLDEADRMLDMGFEPQLRKIRKQLPVNRQTLLFTATWDPSMDRIAREYLRDPVRISVGPASQAAPTIEQALVPTSSGAKNDALLDELNKRKGSVLVFTRTKHRTDRVARYLDSYGVEVGRIHGGRSQGQRNAALDGFRSGKIRVLVATDIAARGIDVPDIAHVINYDLPMVPEDYVHRIGRTGRAGAKGHAVSLLTPEDRSQWNEIAGLLRKTGSTVPTHAGFQAPASGQAPSGASGRHGSRGRAPQGGQRRNAAPRSSQPRTSRSQSSQPASTSRESKPRVLWSGGPGRRGRR